MKENLPDKELIAGIIAGDERCCRSLIERYSSYALTLAVRVLENREDAEEVAHDAFLKAFKSLEGFKMESKFTTWFYRIVVNLAISKKRKKKIDTREMTDRDVDLSHYSQFEEMGHLPAADRTHFIHEALGELNSEERLVISLYYFKELEMEEVSEITGIDRNNLKVKLFRARKKLAVVLTNLLNREVRDLI